LGKKRYGKSQGAKRIENIEERFYDSPTAAPSPSSSSDAVSARHPSKSPL
jgi:hypothetical protein